MKMVKIAIILMIISILSSFSQCCLKIILIPGIFGKNLPLQLFMDQLNEVRPCAKPEIFTLLESAGTFLPIWKQVEAMKPKFLKYIRDNPDGLIVIGGSLGSLIARGLIQTTSEHNVKLLFSLAGPQQGVFSVPFVSYYLPIVKNITSVKVVSELMYTAIMQNTNSIANAWKDPTQYDVYLKRNIFLPEINCEKNHPKCQMFKENMLKLEKFVLLAGDKDQALDPWQTGLFNYYGIRDQYPKIVNMTDQEIYKNDTIGLKTMYEDGRLILCHVPGGDHINISSYDWGLKNCFYNYLI